MRQKTGKMTEILAHGYPSESTKRKQTNEYQHDRVWMIFRKHCVLVLRAIVASILEGLKGELLGHVFPSNISKRCFLSERYYNQSSSNRNLLNNFQT